MPPSPCITPLYNFAPPHFSFYLHLSLPLPLSLRPSLLLPLPPFYPFPSLTLSPFSLLPSFPLFSFYPFVLPSFLLPCPFPYLPPSPSLHPLPYTSGYICLRGRVGAGYWAAGATELGCGTKVGGFAEAIRGRENMNKGGRREEEDGEVNE